MRRSVTRGVALRVTKARASSKLTEYLYTILGRDYLGGAVRDELLAGSV